MQQGKSFVLILILFSIVQVINSHYDQDYYDDYYDEPYPQRPQRQRYNRNDRGMRFRPQRMGPMRRSRNYASPDTSVSQSGGFLSKISGVISLGMCVTKCLLQNIKNCAGMVGCGWSCFSPQEKGPDRNQDDSDVERATYEKSQNLNPGDIVRISICLISCLSKYIPLSPSSVQGFGTCFVIRCVCAEPQ